MSVKFGRLFIAFGVVAAVVPVGAPTAAAELSSPAITPLAQSFSVSDGLAATQVATGSRHACSLDSGVVSCWGDGYHGAIGTGQSMADNSIRAEYPVTVLVGSEGFSNAAVTQIDAGSNTTCAIEGGSVFCWGDNMFGQLGNNSTDNSNVPVKVLDNSAASPAFVNSDIIRISVGGGFACAVRDIPGSGAGTGEHLYCWGFNSSEQLGQASAATPCTNFSGGATECEKVPVLVTPAGGLVNDGSKSFDDVSAGVGSACAVEDGSLFCWGSQSKGELGTGSTTGWSYPPARVQANDGFANTAVTAVANSYQNTCAIEGGVLFCWGSNDSGALGTGSTDFESDDYEELPQKVVDNSDSGFVNASVSAVAVDGAGAYGGYTTCAVASQVLYCWGDDGPSGNLLGTDGTLECPRAAGSPLVDMCSTKALKVGDGEMGNSDIDASSGALSMSAEVACALKSSTVICWGTSARAAAGGFGRDVDSGEPTFVLDTAPPVITAFSPESFGAGDTITVTGENLQSSTMIWIGGYQYDDAENECTVSAATGTSLTCTFGDAETVQSTLRVMNPRELRSGSFSDPEIPEYSWTSGVPVPELVVGQCAGNTLGLTIDGLGSDSAWLMVSPEGEMGSAMLDYDDSDVVDGRLSATFAAAYEINFEDPSNPIEVTLETGVSYTLSGSLDTMSGMLNFETVTFTLVDGGSTDDCPVEGASSESSPSDSSSDDSSSDDSSSSDSSSSDSTSGGSSSSDSTSGGSTSQAPSLVTSANQEAVSAPAGSAKLLINSELVEVDLVQAPEELRRTVAGARSFAQVRALQTLAEDMIAAVQAVLGEGVTLPITVTNTDTGATITGLVSDPVTGEPMGVPVEDVLLIVNQSLALMVGGADGTGDPANIAFDGVLEFGEGGYVAVLAYGLTPGAAGEIVVMSTPRLLDTFTVDTDGGVAVQAEIPSDLAAGEHTVVVAIDGQSASLGFRVLPEMTLPSTGSDSTPFPVAMLVLAVGGLAMLLVTRRRSTI
jgi:LPXTG-motif cell wall-anchored protein